MRFLCRRCQRDDGSGDAGKAVIVGVDKAVKFRAAWIVYLGHCKISQESDRLVAAGALGLNLFQ